MRERRGPLLDVGNQVTVGDRGGGRGVGDKWITSGRSGAGTRYTGEPGVLVLVTEVRLGFSGVIARPDVVNEPRLDPLCVSPPDVLPEIPVRVPRSDPPFPADPVEVGAKTGAVP